VTTADQVRRWSQELALDPGSAAFLPLASTYRDRGRREAALRLCLRGLERHPHHVEAHVLLGELYAEERELVKAHDEWDIALSLDPAHLRARRHLGMLLAEMGDRAASMRHLRAVLGEQPDDSEVADALARLESEGGAPGDGGTSQAAPHPNRSKEGDRGFSASPLDRVSEERDLLGALLLDEHGLLVGGRLDGAGEDRTAEVAASLQVSATGARRALAYLELGAFRGLMVETDLTRLRLEPVADALLVVVAVKDVPLGWLTRCVRQLRGVAEDFLGRGKV